MKSWLKNILDGMGSIFNIFPNTNYNKYISKQTNEEMVSDSFNKAFESLNSAIETFNNTKKK